MHVIAQPRPQALSPFPPLSSTTREEKVREPGNEVGNRLEFCDAVIRQKKK